MEGGVPEIKIGEKTHFTGEWNETSLEVLKTVQPPVPAGHITKPCRKAEFMRAIGMFHQSVQANVISIAKYHAVNPNTCHQHN